MKKLTSKISYILASLTCLLFSFNFFGCTAFYDIEEYQFFNTIITVQVENKKLSSSVKQDLNELFDSLDKEFDRNNQSSFTNTFNNASLNQTFELTTTQAQVLSLSLDSHAYSNGLFDPSIYPLLEVWQFAPNYPAPNFTPPTHSAIESVLTNKQDLTKLQYDSEQKTLTKNIDIKLDFGGILKGYAVQSAGEILKDNGYQKGYISIGGSSLYILSSSTLSVRHPDKIGQNLIEVKLSNLTNVSLSTSGDYEKYYTDKTTGQRYSHIINPITGYPTDTGVRSATIIGGNGAFSDAITTACLLQEYSPSDAENSSLVKFLQKIINDGKANIVFAVYCKDGVNQIITNAKKGEDFTLLDTDYSVVNI